MTCHDVCVQPNKHSLERSAEVNSQSTGQSATVAHRTRSDRYNTEITIKYCKMARVLTLCEFTVIATIVLLKRIVTLDGNR